MQNKGTDYIRKILNDKARLKRWRKVMMCLSCIVVFCTVYVLILPAITLERKTTCGQEEHVHTEECYSADSQLICGKEEHLHTEICYATADHIPDIQSDAAEWEENPVQEDDGNMVQDEGDAGEIEFMPDESSDQEIVNIEGAEDPAGVQEADFTSGDESSIEDMAEPTATPTPAPNSAGGFDLSAAPDKIKDVKLFYRLSDSETWRECTTDDNPEIPANAKIKLQVEYQDIQIQKLIDEYNRKLTYNLPELMRNIIAEGGIFEGNKKVGMVICENRKITVTFYEEYLDSLRSDEQSTINGNFYAQSDVNLSLVPDDTGRITVETGKKTYHLNFEPDAVAKYGQIGVEKTCTSSQVISTANGDYLSYTITVTAGEDGCPDVSVVDTIVSSLDCVDSYVRIETIEKTLRADQDGQNPYETIAEGKSHGTVYLANTTTDGTIPPENANITAPGSMVWKIGNMAAGERRTLTYYVKLKDDVNLKQKEIKNKADVYSKTYERAYDDTSFTPKIDYDMSKSQEGNIVRNSDGTYTIKYRLNFTLKKDTSNYALKNFEFRDLLDAWDIRTDPKALPYISYNRNSVELYVKTDEASDYTSLSSETDYTVSWAKGNDNYITPWNDSNGNPTRFKITGANGKPMTVKPGDSYYATYTVTVKPEALAAMKSDSVDVINRYYAYASNAKSDSGGAFDQVWHRVNVGNYKWDKKTVGTGTTSDQMIEMGTGVKYDLTSGNVPPDTSTSTDTSFTVPAGSYPYTVDVNQTLGDWNATEVSMTDTLSSDKMNYIGYARVEACEYNATTKTYDVKEIKWVKIDGLRSFTLKPSDLGWKGVNYAYKFTYYAKPADSNFSEVKVTNTFSLSGTVIRGNNKFLLDGISSQGEVTVSGSFKMNVKKESWYYEEPKTDATTWKNGKLYWVIEVSGTAILRDTYFRDAISTDSGLTDSYLHSDSLVGIYKGTLPDDKTIIGYGSLEELQTSARLDDAKDKFEAPKLENSKNFTGSDNYSELSIKAKDRIELGAAKLYFIVRTEPQSLPTKYRDAFTYRNHISTSDDGETWIEHGSADKLLCGGADILKELGQTFTYDGTTVTSKKDGADQSNNSMIVKDALPGAGQYASWAFKVNYAGELSGTYRVLETIPDGMELAYIRIKWVGGQNFNTIDSKEIPELRSEGWEERTIRAATDNGPQKITTYYVRGNQALIKLGDFTAGKKRDDYSVDVQVVCRVTDPDVLLGGIEKRFTNQVTLQTKDGREINTATSPATIEPQKKLDKKITSKGTEKITFTIEANPLGEVLSAENGTTLTLIDTLSSTLILDMSSISVINSKTKEAVNYTASFDASSNTLKIAIPCNVPVKITYDATVDVPPDQSVSFSNEAYWEKYSQTGGDSVEEKNYYYAAGGTVGAGKNINLKIIKKDQYNLSSSLQGAEFEIIECKRESDGTITDVSGKKWNGSTNDEGEISFGAGTSTDSAMYYNTIYKVTETKAPSGYVVNREPIYIMVPRKEENTADYSEYVKACISDSKIHKQYNKATYELTVLNHKGEITVEKKFKDPGGYNANPVSGTYTFGLYENADGTNTTNSTKPDGTTSTTAPLQTITITYNAAETTSKTEKFTNLELSKTYYVFELDDSGNPIKNSATAATVNKMEYFTSYKKTTTAGAASEGNSAVSGDTVTVTNQSRVKELPSTGSYGSLIYRLAGTILILFAGLLVLINIKKQTCNNR